MGAAAIWKGSKHKEEAWKLLRFLVTSEFVQRTKSGTGLFAPLSKRQLNWPDFFPASMKPSNGKPVFYESLKDADIQTVYPTTKSNALVTEAVQSIFRNRISAEEGLKALQQPLEKELAKVLSRRVKK